MVTRSAVVVAPPVAPSMALSLLKTLPEDAISNNGDINMEVGIPAVFLYVFSDTTVAAATGGAADAGAPAGTEMSSGGAVSSIKGVIGANFASLSVSFVSLDWTAGTAAAAVAVADAVACASVEFEKSDDTVLNTNGIFGAVFASLSASFTALGSTVAATVAPAAAAAAVVGVLAGSATDVVASESVRTEMFLDDAVSDTGGVGGTNSFSHLVLFVFSDAVTGALVVAGMFLDSAFSSEASR
jgi:hypothetical protein